MKVVEDSHTATMSLNSQQIKVVPSYSSVPLGIVLFFCGYVIIWYLQVGIRVTILGAIRIEMIWAIILILIILVCKKKTYYPKNPLTNYVFIFIASILISIPFSCNVTVSWDIFIDRVIKFFFMGVFIACFVKSPNDLRLFLTSFLLACGKMGQEGVHGQLTGSLVWQNQGIMRLHGPTPLYLHPNSFSGMALGVLPFILYLWKIVNKWQKVFLLMLFICSFSIVIFTGSRTGYFGFIFMLGVAFLRSKNKLRTIVIGAIFVAITVTCIPEQYKGRFLSSFSSYEDVNTSAGKRVEILKDSVSIFFDHPFGVGAGAFPTMRQKTFGRMQDTHNLYLEVLTNIGVQGFVAFILLFTKMLILLRKLDKKFGLQIASIARITSCDDELVILKHSIDLKLMQAVTRAVFLFVCVRLIVGFFGMDLYEIYWWFALGLTIALFQMSEIAERKTKFLFKQQTQNASAFTNGRSSKMLNKRTGK